MALSQKGLFTKTQKLLTGMLCLVYLAAMGTVLIRPPKVEAIAPIRVNVGGPALIDSKGQVWQADFGFNTGITNSTASPIAGTVDDALYQTERWDFGTSPEMTYNFPVPNGVYQVRLHFAEIYGLTSFPGGRVFDVKAENDLVLDNLDIYAQVGANTALVKEFATTITDNQVTLDFIHGAANNPKISAIEIIEVSQWPTHPEFGSTNPKQVDMMVVGDSYTAGNGAGAANYFFKSADDMRPNSVVRQRDTTPPSLGCFRNHDTWGAQAFRKTQTLKQNIGAFVNAACSGDVAGNISGQAGVPQQLDGFDATRRNNMDLIALTIGGNDLNFTNVVVNCFIAQNGPSCETSLQAAEAMLAIPSGSTSQIVQRTQAALVKVRTDYPNAKIVLVGYPLFWEDRNLTLTCASCPGGVVKPGQRLEAGLNSLTLQQIALTNLLNSQTPNRFGYLALHTGNNTGFFDGHGLHGADADWINDLSTPDPNGFYHPNLAGYTAIADNLYQLPIVQQLF
jgi:lysophospholipase L1-like esterase